MRPRIHVLPIALFAIAGLAHQADAQQTFGSVVGVMTDTSGAPIGGANATLTNVDTGDRRQVATGDQGEYQVPESQPGQLLPRYSKEQDFKRYARPGLVVAVNGVVRADVALDVGDVSERIEVAATAPLVQTENSTMSQVVAGRAVEELPLNGRNILNLVALAPGVVPQGGSMGNLQGQNIFAAGNFAIGGSAGNQSASYLDGAPLNVTYGNLTALVPSQDSISEFRVQTSNNTAEFGRYTGGVVNLSSKAGTNDFHGDVYEYIRNRALNAGDFFANRAGSGKPAFTQNQFGGSVGGPIIKNRTFFHGGYEGFRLRQGKSFVETVPTAAMLTGDFSNYRNASGSVIPVYDPLTTCGQYGNAACATGQTTLRSPLPGNILPPSRFDSVANKLRNRLFAAPNQPGQPNTNLFNFAALGSTGGDNDQVFIRGDQNLSDKQRLFARYSRWNLSNIAADLYKNGYYFSNPEDFVTNQAVLGDSYIFSPNTIGDLRLSFLRFFYRRTPSSFGIDESAEFGFPSYFHQIPLPVLPGISISGYNTGSTQTIGSTNNNYAVSGSINRIVGQHQIKAGIDLRRMEFNFYQVNSSGGSFTFDTGATSANPTANSPTGNGLASFLLGYASAGSVIIPNLVASHTLYQGYFVQDQWQATRKLTVNYGVRWEIPGVFKERRNRAAVFLGDATSPLAQATGLPLKGALALVGTSAYPDEGINAESFKPVWAARWCCVSSHREDGYPCRWRDLLHPVGYEFPTRGLGERSKCPDKHDGWNNQQFSVVREQAERPFPGRLHRSFRARPELPEPPLRREPWGELKRSDYRSKARLHLAMELLGTASIRR